MKKKQQVTIVICNHFSQFYFFQIFCLNPDQLLPLQVLLKDYKKPEGKLSIQL